MKEKIPLKLHLGCGANYLEGYVNIDLPPDGQTVMTAKVDLHADITELDYPQGLVDEIRSHHVLEHFSRQRSLRLLLMWRKWLAPGGMLVIETPDFETAAKKFVTADISGKFKLARHMFGSHEAGWAVHQDWWGEEKFTFIMRVLGFRIVEMKKIAVHVGKFVPDRFADHVAAVLPGAVDTLDNIIVKAEKLDIPFNEAKAARAILSESLVGKDTGMLDAWLLEFDR